MEYLSCAVIGCHPTRFKFKYQEQNNGCKKIKRVLERQLRQMYENGVRRFFVPGTLGVGIWAGELLLRMKEQPEYADLELMVVLPYAAHDSGWDRHNKTRLSFLLRHASKQITLAEKGDGKNYRQTYLYLADQCDVLIAVCDDPPPSQEDVGHAVDVAKVNGRTLRFIQPDNGKVTYHQCE